MKIFIIFFLLFSMAITATSQSQKHIHFYFHDIVAGPNQTAFVVVSGPSNTSASSSGIPFGDISMFDDPLTEGPDLSSKLVGRAQGTYIVASQTEIALLMTMTIVFVDGEYNGSTLSIMGRNPSMSPTRELPVIGGSGVFRMARGYALLKTVKLDTEAIVEYNVYVDYPTADADSPAGEPSSPGSPGSPKGGASSGEGGHAHPLNWKISIFLAMCFYGFF